MNALYTKEVKMNRQIVAQPIWIMYVAVANQTTNIQFHANCDNLIRAVAAPSI